MLSTIPCALSLHCDTSLYSLTQLIREARTLAQNSKQGFFYYIGNLSCLAGCLLITYALGMPPIFTGYQLIWLTWILLPFISTSFLFTSHDAEVMTFMPVKNTKNLKDKWIHVRYYFYRFCLPSVSVVAFFAS